VKPELAEAGASGKTKLVIATLDAGLERRTCVQGRIKLKFSCIVILPYAMDY